jgi:hypothetical protein
MAQIYCAYLAKFPDAGEVREFLLELLWDAALVDWQKIWILAALSQEAGQDDAAVLGPSVLATCPTKHDARNPIR